MSFVWQRRIRPVSYPLMKLMWLLPSVLIHNAQTGPFLICWIIWMGFIIKRRMSRLLWRRIGWIRLMLLCWDLEDWIVGMSFLNRLVGRGVWFSKLRGVRCISGMSWIQAIILIGVKRKVMQMLVLFWICAEAGIMAVTEWYTSQVGLNLWICQYLQHIIPSITLRFQYSVQNKASSKMNVPILNSRLKKQRILAYSRWSPEYWTCCRQAHHCCFVISI